MRTLAKVFGKLAKKEVFLPPGHQSELSKGTEHRIQTNKVVVVVSAMSGETNRLLGLAKEISENADGRELDMIAATGEQASSGLLAIALQAVGLQARSYAGWQVPVRTDSASAASAAAAAAARRAADPTVHTSAMSYTAYRFVCLS